MSDKVVKMKGVLGDWLAMVLTVGVRLKVRQKWSVNKYRELILLNIRNYEHSMAAGSFKDAKYGKFPKCLWDITYFTNSAALHLNAFDSRSRPYTFICGKLFVANPNKSNLHIYAVPGCSFRPLLKHYNCDVWLHYSIKESIFVGLLLTF